MGQFAESPGQRFDGACPNLPAAALADARSVDEGKDIRDKVETMRAYARMANDTQLEMDAAELRLRAERHLGSSSRPKSRPVA